MLKAYNTRTSYTGKDAFTELESRNFDAAILDVRLPDANGIDILKTIQHKWPDIAVIVITGEASINIAVEAMKYGAADFVAKPVKKERLLISLENALEKKRLKKVETQFNQISRTHFCDFIGSSPEMQAVYHTIENAAHSDASVLITGESGTGKELTARAIHTLSHRKEKNLISINCGAIPDNLIESEIFGHVKGAFTGAVTHRDGAASMADKGSLFLDELIEMPLHLQVKLLRFVQTGNFTRVGETLEKHADIRFICATNKDPITSVSNGIFREDLFYRLNIIPIHLPPLRNRKSDITLLSDHFLKKMTEQEGKKFTSISPEAKEKLLQHNWPGNVRELENTLRRAIVLNNNTTLLPEHIPLAQEHTLPSSNTAAPYNNESALLQKPLHKEDIKPLKDYEQTIIEHAIKLCNGNITQAARRLDINPATIHRKQLKWSTNNQQ